MESECNYSFQELEEYLDTKIISSEELQQILAEERIAFEEYLEEYVSYQVRHGQAPDEVPVSGQVGLFRSLSYGDLLVVSLLGFLLFYTIIRDIYRKLRDTVKLW